MQFQSPQRSNAVYGMMGIQRRPFQPHSTPQQQRPRQASQQAKSFKRTPGSKEDCPPNGVVWCADTMPRFQGIDLRRVIGVPSPEAFKNMSPASSASSSSSSSSSAAVAPKTRSRTDAHQLAPLPLHEFQGPSKPQSGMYLQPPRPPVLPVLPVLPTPPPHPVHKENTPLTPVHVPTYGLPPHVFNSQPPRQPLQPPLLPIPPSIVPNVRQHQQSGNVEPKQHMKFVHKEIRRLERNSLSVAYKYATDQLNVLPINCHWRIGLELADLCKRANDPDGARAWFQWVHELAPSEPQSWLDHMRLEEDCGNVEAIKMLLVTGMSATGYSEALLVKGLRVLQDQGCTDDARAILGQSVKGIPLSKTWKAQLEGALMENRAGHFEQCRSILRALRSQLPHCGALWLESARCEEQRDYLAEALQIIDEGLTSNRKYGPLWFANMRVKEKLMYEGDSITWSALRSTFRSARQCLSKDLIWKVYLQEAEAECRAKHFAKSRLAFAESTQHCPSSCRWKCWIKGAKMELLSGQTKTARALLAKAQEHAPAKHVSTVFTERAKLEAFLGDDKRAIAVLADGLADARSAGDWKMFLESIVLHLHLGYVSEAYRLSVEAVKCHPTAGRLWAIHIQLHRHTYPLDEQSHWDVFRQAILQVPKSGEVWTEGARFFLNPCSTATFDLQQAQRYLEFAMKFTPQFGDSFVEMLRVHLLLYGPDAPTDGILQRWLNANPNYGTLWKYCQLRAQRLKGSNGDHKTVAQSMMTSNCSLSGVLHAARDLLCQELRANTQVFQSALDHSTMGSDVKHTGTQWQQPWWTVSSMNGVTSVYQQLARLQPDAKFAILHHDQRLGQ